MIARSNILLFLCLFLSFTRCKSQSTFGTQYLQLEKVIPLPKVSGRIDHLDINIKDQIIYVAALGNNSLEIVNLKQNKDIHSIRGLDEPQGVGYIPQTNEIFVANGGSGTCYFYNAYTYRKTGTVQLSSDADDVYYDSASHKIYVGYGNGGIAAIDVNSHQQTGDAKLPVHPERFQLDRTLGEIFVNLPSAHAIGVIDVKQMKLIDKWKIKSLNSNFPMALDSLHHHILVGYRQPATLAILDAKTGKLIATSTMAGDADDMYYDQENGRIYVSGGSGYMDIFTHQDQNSYVKIAHIASRNGARTSLLAPNLHLFILAERANGEKEAKLVAYKVH